MLPGNLYNHSWNNNVKFILSDWGPLHYHIVYYYHNTDFQQHQNKTAEPVGGANFLDLIGGAKSSNLLYLSIYYK